MNAATEQVPGCDVTTFAWVFQLGLLIRITFIIIFVLNTYLPRTHFLLFSYLLWFLSFHYNSFLYFYATNHSHSSWSFKFSGIWIRVATCSETIISIYVHIYIYIYIYRAVHEYTAFVGHDRQVQYIHQNRFINPRYPNCFSSFFSLSSCFIYLNKYNHPWSIPCNYVPLFIPFVLLFRISHYVSSFLVYFCSSHCFLFSSYRDSFVNFLFVTIFSNKIADTRNCEARRNNRQLI